MFYENAVFVGQCLELGNGTYAQGSCTSNSVSGNIYAEAGCSGTVVNSTTQSNGNCYEIITCNGAANFALITVFLVVCAAIAL